jgi:hypothetical protein
VLTLAVYPLTHVVRTPLDSHSAQRPCAEALRVSRHAASARAPEGMATGYPPSSIALRSAKRAGSPPRGTGAARGVAS